MSDATWPVELAGVVESVVTTRGPGGRYNAAALGLHAGDDHDPADPVRARTWGDTRTRRNFAREGTGHVQFVRDPLVFVEAALGIHETGEPVLDAAAAWVAVEATRADAGESGGTAWTDWELAPVDAGVRRRAVPRTDRGYAAVVEMTVAASRLGVPAYDDATLRDRLAYFADVTRTCGGPRVREAVERVAALSAWSPDSGAPGEAAKTDGKSGAGAPAGPGGDG
jgi:hypothetical protein